MIAIIITKVIMIMIIIAIIVMIMVIITKNFLNNKSPFSKNNNDNVELQIKLF